jgi:small-conductance mechanosensitive channel
MPDGELVVIPNGQVLQVTNLSSEWARATVDVPLPVGVDIVRARELLRKVGSGAIEDEELEPLLLDAPTVMGVESFDVDRINLRMVARTLRGKQFEVARGLRIRDSHRLPRRRHRRFQAPADENAAGHD